MLRVMLDENNDLPSGGPRLVGGVESAGVALQAVYATQAGEWPYNLSFGTQWRGVILRKYFDPATTRSAIATPANSWVPDIEPITGNQITLDTTTYADIRQVDITITDVMLAGSTTTGPITFTIPTIL